MMFSTSLADVAGLGQIRGVRDGEGHVEDLRERLREQRSCRKPVGPSRRMFDLPSSTSSAPTLASMRL